MHRCKVEWLWLGALVWLVACSGGQANKEAELRREVERLKSEVERTKVATPVRGYATSAEAIAAYIKALDAMNVEAVKATMLTEPEAQAAVSCTGGANPMVEGQRLENVQKAIVAVKANEGRAVFVGVAGSKPIDAFEPGQASAPCTCKKRLVLWRHTAQWAHHVQGIVTPRESKFRLVEIDGRWFVAQAPLLGSAE